jgi:hypothetical protein
MERALVGLVCLTAVAPLAAETPRVTFDMPFTVACRDVTPGKFAAANPGQKLIEARFEISSLLAAGQERDLTQYFIRIENPQRPLAIADYLPKTLHESRMAGPVTITDTKENTASLGIGLTGKYEFITAISPTAGIGHKKTSCVKYDLLPPLEAVAASGTLLRGSAVFFKLKATPRHPLEGSREFGLVLKVPAAWRTEYVQVRCEAEGIQRSVVSTFNEEVNCGKREFVVALYQEGDEQARLTAESFARRKAAEASRAQQPSKSSNAWTLSAPWDSLRR